MTTTRSPRYRQFLRQLRAARLEAGLTQVEVGKALGKPQSFVSRVELGEQRLDIVEVEQFAKLYKKPLDYFLP